ncbi:MAG: T9SS type A sorting domain-containing protein [Bacteroidales bacterium]|nr:T9SS type A sorting domain-containing protein [Bacteroidales bacterium]
MKKVYALIIGLCISFTGFSQSCLPEGITFSTQAQIDSFPIDYPGCTEIIGPVTICGNDISDLSGLSSLTSVDNNLAIGWEDSENPLLTSLAGLEGLTFVRTLYIVNNLNLNSLAGLNNLDTIQWFLSVVGNQSLINLNGLDNLKYIGSDIFIEENNSMINFAGLEGLTRISQAYVYDNPALVDFTGLNNVDHFSGIFDIVGNASLINFHGLENLTKADLLKVWYNENLVNLDGLQGVTTLSSFLNLDNNPSLVDLTGLDNLVSIGDDLYISANESLSSIKVLEKLNSIDGNLTISSNSALTSLDGLDSIAASSINDLQISWNSNLSTCDVESVCDYLADPNGNVFIFGNAAGCNSVEEVENECTAGINVNKLLGNPIYIHPNPASTQIIVETLLVQNSCHYILSDLNGQPLIQGQLSPSKTIVDISELVTGIYYLKVTNNNFVNVFKIVKNCY